MRAGSSSGVPRLSIILRMGRVVGLCAKVLKDAVGWLALLSDKQSITN
jgi:hypothetical protein